MAPRANTAQYTATMPATQFTQDSAAGDTAPLEPKPASYGPPSRAARPDPTIETFERCLGFRARQQGHRKPDDRRHPDGNYHRQRKRGFCQVSEVQSKPGQNNGRDE